MAHPDFGRKLKELREQHGLSLRRLGGMIHCSHGHLWDLESGTKRPSLSVAVLLDHTEDSVHLTFVIRERTGFWVGEKLARAAIESTPLRRVITPANIVSEDALAAQIDQARSLLVDWLGQVDAQAFAAELLDAARSELEPDYI